VSDMNKQNEALVARMAMLFPCEGTLEDYQLHAEATWSTLLLVDALTHSAPQHTGALIEQIHRFAVLHAAALTEVVGSAFSTVTDETSAVSEEGLTERRSAAAKMKKVLTYLQDRVSFYEQRSTFPNYRVAASSELIKVVFAGGLRSLRDHWIAPGTGRLIAYLEGMRVLDGSKLPPHCANRHAQIAECLSPMDDLLQPRDRALRAGWVGYAKLGAGLSAAVPPLERSSCESQRLVQVYTHPHMLNMAGPSSAPALLADLARVSTLLHDEKLLTDYMPLVDLMVQAEGDGVNPFVKLEAMKKGTRGLNYYLNDTLGKCETDVATQGGGEHRALLGWLATLSDAVRSCYQSLMEQHRLSRVRVLRDLVDTGRKATIDANSRLVAIFFESTKNTLVDISRRYRYIARFLKVESSGDAEESQLRRDLLVMLNHAVEVKRDTVFDEEDMLEVADSHFATLQRHCAELQNLAATPVESQDPHGKVWRMYVFQHYFVLCVRFVVGQPA
jgi:hypothetical protein